MSARCILIVMDGCGVGAMPDASFYGPDDSESATLPHVAQAVGRLNLPTLEVLGLGRIVEIRGLRSDIRPRGAYGRAAEASAGKDSVTGHWEMTGIVTATPFPTYPNGFPPSVVAEFEQIAHRKILGNKPASGTEIIAQLGEEHVRTGQPIVYTSADSVFQIAAHEEVIPLTELYRLCEEARRMLVAPNNVQRVIARPFVGTEAHSFKRTGNRRDFPLAPPEPNLLSELSAGGRRIHAVGVVAELFPRAYFTTAQRTQSNPQHIAAIEAAIAGDGFDLLFANCEDFDMLYGHRNDPAGFAQALVEFDAALSRIVAALRPDDLLILTADHGNDPVTPSTDHSREYVPILAVGGCVPAGLDLGTRQTMADIGATIAAHLGNVRSGAGESFV